MLNQPDSEKIISAMADIILGEKIPSVPDFSIATVSIPQ